MERHWKNILWHRRNNSGKLFPESTRGDNLKEYFDVINTSQEKMLSKENKQSLVTSGDSSARLNSSFSCATDLTFKWLHSFQPRSVMTEWNFLQTLRRSSCDVGQLRLKSGGKCSWKDCWSSLKMVYQNISGKLDARGAVSVQMSLTSATFELFLWK